MTIVNDVVTFQASDFSGLSAFAIAALKQQDGTLAQALARLSTHVNSIIKSAKQRYVVETAGDNSDVAVLLQKFAAADAPTLAAAADEIAALSAALGSLPP